MNGLFDCSLRASRQLIRPDFVKQTILGRLYATVDRIVFVDDKLYAGAVQHDLRRAVLIDFREQLVAML